MTNPDQYITVTRTRLCGCNNFGELRILWWIISVVADILWRW